MPASSNSRLRRVAAILCLAVVFAAEAVSSRPKEVRGRAGALVAFAGMAPEDAMMGGSGFAFARRLGPFLRGVARGTPPTATIALSYASEKGDLATYASAYVLAPRRVVPAARLAEADFAATFRKTPGDSVGDSSRPRPDADGRFAATPVPFGELARVR